MRARFSADVNQYSSFEFNRDTILHHLECTLCCYTDRGCKSDKPILNKVHILARSLDGVQLISGGSYTGKALLGGSGEEMVCIICRTIKE